MSRKPDPFPPGKDASLQQTIDVALSHAEQLGVSLDFTAWNNPLPNCWSVHLAVNGIPQIYTNGKGISREAAKASALGEFFERLATGFFFSDYCLSAGQKGVDARYFFDPREEAYHHPGEDDAAIGRPTELLSPQLWQLYDPARELQVKDLLDFNFDQPDRGILSLPFTDVSSQQKVHFPISLLNTLYVSNGMAAGNSRPEANSQALSEIFERHVKRLVIGKGISLPEIPQEILEQYPHLMEMIVTLKAHGFLVMVKDASLGGKFPVACVLCFDQDTHSVMTSFGCNCRLQIAIERALTELLQGRSIENLSHTRPPIVALEHSSNSFNFEDHFINSEGLIPWSMLRDRPAYPFTPWDFKGTTAKEWQYLVSLAQDQGYRVFAIDYIHCGLFAARLVVPGMSEIYAIDELLYNNHNRGAELRRLFAGMNHGNDSSLQSFQDRLIDLGFANERRVAELIGILQDPGTTAETLNVGELRAFLALACNELDEAGRHLDWCATAGIPGGERGKFLKLLSLLLEFSRNAEDPHAYRSILKQLHGLREVETAQQVIRGTSRLPGIDPVAMSAGNSSRHLRLTELYASICRRKEVTYEEC
jgi:ribosomal protein S12 methylthiotransferase accessory factor